MHSAVSGFLAERHRYTGNTADTLLSAVKSRYVTRCCPPGIASPRYLYHSMRETRHSSFVRICIISRKRGGFYTQGRERLRFLDQYIRPRSTPHVRVKSRGWNWSIDFFFFLSIFRDNETEAETRPLFSALFLQRDNRFPRLITRTKWTRISWLSTSIDFLSVETMSGRSYSEIRWRPKGEFRRNARINQQGSYSTPVRNSVCNL